MIRAYLRDRKFDTPWLFVGERGDQLSRHAVQYIVRQAATRAQLSAHPHTLRHSCGYYLAERGYLALSLALTEQHLDGFVAATRAFAEEYADLLPPAAAESD